MPLKSVTLNKYPLKILKKYDKISCMKYLEAMMKVIKKQTNSHMCLICGVDNEFGLKAPFYEMEDNSVISLFQFKQFHQSYPERTHGGMISCMLDEIIGRAIWVFEPSMWGVTMELTVKYRKPVPLDTPLKAQGIITRNTSRIFEGNGYIYDMNGVLLAEAKATYFKMSLDKVVSTDTHQDINVMIPDDVREIL